jgi:hypothetical protein
MAVIYKKNSQNIYKIPFYRFLWLWSLLFAFLALLSFLIYSFSSINVVLIFSLLMFLISMIFVSFEIYLIAKRFKKSLNLRTFLIERQIEKVVTKTLLETMTVNQLRDTPHVAVPRVEACASTLPNWISLDIEKLPGMYDVEKLTEDIDSSFRGKLSNYAVTSAIVTTDGLFYKFILEDVGSDKTWRPRNFDDIKAEKYVLKLQEGLSINLSERPHIAVYGRTGSKKSTVLLGWILQLFAMYADVRFLDGKDEFSAFKNFYPSGKISSEIDDVFNQLDDILEIVKKRQKIMSNEVRKRKKIGLKASDVGLRPVVLIADEVGSLVALMDSKQSKKFIADLTAIIQRGRSVGVSVIISTQDPSVETLPSKIRQQFSTKILLGSANADTQRMAFGEVATVGNVEDFRGFYVCDGLTTQPMKYFVCDLYSYNFNDLEAFERAYKIGLKNKQQK